jgi:hypothetical protein
VATLKVLSGPEAGRSLDIDRELVIGRRDADLSIDDSEMSRRHAAVRPIEDGVGVRDLGSTNGTLVDGKPITGEVVLSGAGRITVGNTEIAVQPAVGATTRRPVGAPPAPAAAPPRQGAPPPGARPPKAAALLRRPWLAAIGLGLLLGAIVATVVIATSDDDEESPSAKGEVVDVPVRFTVKDQNRSLLRCKAAGGTYRVVGRLVAPASGPGSAVTLYLHGVLLASQFEWHFKGVLGYDFATEMAKLGHTSVIIDRVGYGKTRPIPTSGAGTCLGSQADHTHQIINALRRGRFSVRGPSTTEPKAFPKVALAGYSLGGNIAELEAGSFRDPDALVIVSWSDEGLTDYGTPIPEVIRLCSPGSAKRPGGKNGYFPTLPDRKLPPLLSKQADPRVISAMLRAAELDPCGPLTTGAQWFEGLAATAKARVQSPVLMIHGIFDVLFHRSAWERSFRRFTGTRDKKRIGIPDGQLIMLDRNADSFRRQLSAWLADHGF